VAGAPRALGAAHLREKLVDLALGVVGAAERRLVHSTISAAVATFCLAMRSISATPSLARAE
jgi:hypothetical protein